MWFLTNVSYSIPQETIKTTSKKSKPESDKGRRKDTIVKDVEDNDETDGDGDDDDGEDDGEDDDEDEDGEQENYASITD